MGDGWGHFWERSCSTQAAPRGRDQLVTAEVDLDQIRAVRNGWQFYRDRRPETYLGLTKP
jgi:beta-ureidopropionase